MRTGFEAGQALEESSLRDDCLKDLYNVKHES